MEAKRQLNSALPQVIGELMCAHELNATLPEQKEVYAILTNMSEWQFFRWDGRREPLPVIGMSSVYQFAELRGKSMLLLFQLLSYP